MNMFDRHKQVQYIDIVTNMKLTEYTIKNKNQFAFYRDSTKVLNKIINIVYLNGIKTVISAVVILYNNKISPAYVNGAVIFFPINKEGRFIRGNIILTKIDKYYITNKITKFYKNYKNFMEQKNNIKIYTMNPLINKIKLSKGQTKIFYSLTDVIVAENVNVENNKYKYKYIVYENDYNFEISTNITVFNTYKCCYITMNNIIILQYNEQNQNIGKNL